MKIKNESDILAEHVETCHFQNAYWLGSFKDEIPLTLLDGGSGGGSGSGSSICTGVLERDITADINVGHVTIGTVLRKGMTFTQVMEQILVGGGTSEPLAFITSSNILTEKWNPFSTGTTLSISASTTAGAATISKIEVFKDEETSPITSFTASEASLVKAYNYSNPINATTTFKVKVTDTNSNVATADTVVNVVLPYFYGATTSKTVSELTSFTQFTDIKNTETFTYSPNVEYIVLAFDNTYVLNDIIDEDGDSVKTEFDIKALSISRNGKSYTYNLYISKQLVKTDSNFVLTYSFS